MNKQNPAHPPSDKNVNTSELADPASVSGASRSEHRPGFFFWSLAPFLVLFLVVMAFCVDKDDPVKIGTLCAVEAAALALLVGLWNPYRFWWAWRSLSIQRPFWIFTATLLVGLGAAMWWIGGKDKDVLVDSLAKNGGDLSAAVDAVAEKVGRNAVGEIIELKFRSL